MKIRHEHVREAVKAWSALSGGRKIPAGAISLAYFELGMTEPHLHGDEHYDALNRNRQKIFRWLESDSKEARDNVQLLLPAIEKSMPPFLLASMRSHSSETLRDLVVRKKRIDEEFEALFGAMIALSDRANNGGPVGNALVH